MHVDHNKNEQQRSPSHLRAALVAYAIMVVVPCATTRSQGGKSTDVH